MKAESKGEAPPRSPSGASQRRDELSGFSEAAGRALERSALYEDALGAAYDEWVSVMGYFVQQDDLYVVRFNQTAAQTSDALRQLRDGSTDPEEAAELDAFIETHARFIATDQTILDRIDAARASADFELKDLSGKSWTLSALKGKVVLVNFWATWCPPCRKEMPDLEELSKQFKDQGLVVLAISDEEDAKVRPFIAEHGYSFNVLLDPGRTVSERYFVDGIPKNFVFDRDGKLVAQSMDMRTRKQFLALLAKAGLHENR